jgi:hypothetical protein
LEVMAAGGSKASARVWLAHVRRAVLATLSPS